MQGFETALQRLARPEVLHLLEKVGEGQGSALPFLLGEALLWVPEMMQPGAFVL